MNTLTLEEKDSIRKDIKNSEDNPETLELASDFLSSINKKYSFYSSFDFLNDEPNIYTLDDVRK